MPIQKDRSKDLPGKTGYSQRDREKILDVVRNPGKYDVDPDDNSEPRKPGCPLMLLLLAGSLTSVGLVINWLL
jgi:hypothetical protein